MSRSDITIVATKAVLAAAALLLLVSIAVS